MVLGQSPHAPCSLCAPGLVMQVEEALLACGNRKDARAQDLSLPQFAAFYRQLQEQVLSQLEA